MKNISLIVPAYNCESTIESCIDYVMNGSFKPFEIIIVNDKSTDKTPFIIDKIKKKNKLIKTIILENNSGPATARNKGVDLAKSDYVFFLDSDTQIDCKALEIYESICHKYDAIVGCYTEKPVNNNISAWYKSLLYFYMLGGDKVRKYDQFSASCAGIKKQVFLEVGGYDEWFKPGCDLENEELGHRIVDKGFNLVLNPQIQAGHKYPKFIRLIETFFKRTALWSQMFLVRKKFSQAGNTDGMGLACLSALGIFVSLPFSLINQNFLFLCLFFLIIFLIKLYNFYKYVYLKYPNKFMGIFLLSFIFSAVIGGGAIYGFLKVLTNSSDLYKKFNQNKV